MKKIAIAAVTLIVLFIAAIVVIPLVVDVDKYRSQIIEAVNQKINGKFDLGKLKLSLWGQIRVEVAGVSLTDTAGNKVVSVNDAYFHLPFAPILTGSPVITFKMQNPAVSVVKDKNGKLNVMSLMKESPKQAAESAAASQNANEKKAEPKSGGHELPGLALRARFGMEMKDALVTYKDQLTGLDSQIRNLNFVLRDLSLSHPTEIEVWADLDTKMGKSMALKGPFRFKGDVKPQMNGSELSNVDVHATLDLDKLQIASGQMFDKKQGMACNVELQLNASEKELKIQKFIAKFFNAEVRVTGNLLNLKAAPGETANPIVNINVASNEIDLKPWNELIPMLKDYDLGGTAALEAEAKGPAQQLGYKGRLDVKKLTAKAPRLKAQPEINGTVSFVTDQIDKIAFTMKAPGNDLAINGKLVSFTKPRADIQVTSNGMDLDQLIDWPPPKAKGEAPKGEANPGAPTAATDSKGANGAPTSDYDALIEPMRENKMLRETTATLGVNIKMMKAKNVTMSDMVGTAFFGGPGRELVAGISQFTMRMWKGSVKASGSTNMAPKAPTYQFNAQASGLELKEAVSSQMTLLKNTILGTANFAITGTGASYNPDPAIQNMNAKGNMKVVKATFATIDVGKMASEALNKGLDKIAQKVPQAKGKSVGAPGGRESRYDVISSDFTIANGKFSAPNFQAVAEKNQGVDLKGSTVVGLKDYALDAKWQVIDTYNYTRAKDISVEQNGVQVQNILAEKGQPVKFPVSVGCTALAPCYSYTEVPEYLASIALANVSSALTGKAKAEVQKKASELIKQAPPAVQNKLEDLKNKLFH